MEHDSFVSGESRCIFEALSVFRREALCFLVGGELACVRSDAVLSLLNETDQLYQARLLTFYLTIDVRKFSEGDRPENGLETMVGK